MAPAIIFSHASKNCFCDSDPSRVRIVFNQRAPDSLADCDSSGLNRNGDLHRPANFDRHPATASLDGSAWS